MFRFHKTLDIVTVFHKAGSPASTRVANLLKQVSANASAETTADEASKTPASPENKREPFELNITEDPPTAEQVQTILEYVGDSGIVKVVKGAHNKQQALKLFKDSKENFLRPVVVDWNNGKAVAGDSESAILNMLKAQK